MCVCVSGGGGGGGVCVCVRGGGVCVCVSGGVHVHEERLGNILENCEKPAATRD